MKTESFNAGADDKQSPPIQPEAGVNGGAGEPVVPKPQGKKKSFAERFGSSTAAIIAGPGVAPQPSALPVMRISEAKDFVRLHPDEEEYWTGVMCFVGVPIDAKRTELHPIDEGLAMQYLHESQIKRFRLALASRPYKGALFLCIVPCQNLENGYNKTALECCTIAKSSWVQAVSLKYKGVEAYESVLAENQNAYNDRLEWPTATMDDILNVTFAGKMIETPDCPAMLRLRGIQVNPVKS
jgi:hypothetical protein